VVTCCLDHSDFDLEKALGYSLQIFPHIKHLKGDVQKLCIQSTAKKKLDVFGILVTRRIQPSNITAC